MEKNPPEKSNSFANANVDANANASANANPDDNTNNNNNNPNPDPPSSPSPPSSDPLAGDSKCDSLDNSAEPPTDGDSNNNSKDATTLTTEEVAEKTEEEPTEEEEEPPAPDLSKLSEDIDRFLSLFESNQIPEEIPNSVDGFANLVEVQIAKYSSDEDPIKWRQDSDEDSTLLEAVNRISKLTTALSQLSSDAKYSSSINRTGSVLQRAMSYLEDEFRSILESRESETTIDTKGREQSSNSNSDSSAIAEPDSAKAINFPGYSAETISNLNRIAAAMIAAGYETECIQVYNISRRNAFEEALKNIGLEKISIDDVLKMHWESLEGEIGNWIKVFKRCVTILFAGERKLCDAVFQENPSLSESFFGNLACGVVIQLLNFVEAVAMTKRSAEKLFKFLDMYEALRDMMPEFDNLFSGQFTEDLKNEISYALCRLGEAAVSIFCDLENSIKNDSSKTPVPGGAVHPLTRYTMNYLKYACEYKDTLEQIFQKHQKIDQSDVARSDKDGSPHTNSNRGEKLSPFAVQLMTVMDMLGTNIEAKSKIYKDVSLNHIFLMNNGRYIMQKIKGSKEIYDLIGDPWCRKRSSDLRQYHKNYQRETWNKVLGCLRDEGLQVHGKVAKPVLKERFKTFNATFEEIHKTQSAWIVSDTQLQSELRVSISAVVIPAYRSFLGRFSQYLDSGRQSDKYIKYCPEDIESSIDELFEGNPMSMARRRT